MLPDNYVWIKDFEGLYAINREGSVVSFHKNKPRELKPAINRRTGYVSCSLHSEVYKINKYIHRLVAEAFIPNPENKPCINHIDHNRSNNHYSNLEWCTYQENTRAMLEHHPDFRDRATQNKLKDDELKYYVTEEYLGNYLGSNRIIERLKNQPESFWIDVGVPKEILTVVRKDKENRSTLLSTWKYIVHTLQIVNKDMSLSEVSKLCGKDFTTISKIRSGTRWVKEVAIYNKYKNNKNYLKFL